MKCFENINSGVDELPLSLFKVGFEMICVTVATCPEESVEVNVDVNADGAVDVVRPSVVIVINDVLERVILEQDIIELASLLN